MLMISPEYKCSNEILTITAMLSGMSKILLAREYFWRTFFTSVPNIWLRPTNQRREADAAKALLTVPDGDHLTLMNVFNQYMLRMYNVHFLGCKKLRSLLFFFPNRPK